MLTDNDLIHIFLVFEGSSCFSLFRVVKMSAQAQVPSPPTISLRAKLAKFLRRQHTIWASKDVKSEQKGTVATSAVLAEAIHRASAFLLRDDGQLDLYWVKTDTTLEAVKSVEAGYWRAFAGRGPRREQDEQMEIHGCPPEVMKEINRTNDQNLIATHLYGWSDLWNLCTGHDLLWLACAFLSGTLCILQPILVVGESSKIARLFQEHSLAAIFRENIPGQIQKLPWRHFHPD